MRVLIVDDLHDARLLLRYMVEKNGHEAIEAANGAEGLEIAKNSRPDLIISDALMPVMDGFRFLRALKADAELGAIPFVIYSSTYKEDQDVRLAMSLGADAYLFKPMEPAELWQEVTAVLERIPDHRKYPSALIKDDADYLKRYSEVVATKLEEKVLALETALAQRRQAEISLQENIALMRAIADSALDAVLMLDRDGRISYWNPAAERIFGYTDKEAIGRDLHQLLAPERYRKVAHAALPGFERTGQGHAIGVTLELEACHRQGHEISVELSLSSLEFRDGWHAVGIIRDISERKRAQELLAQQKDELTAIFENAPFMMMVLDHEKRIRKTNSLTCSGTGLSVKEMEGLRAGEALRCLHASDGVYGSGAHCPKCALQQTINDTFATGQAHYQVEAILSIGGEGREQRKTFLISTTGVTIDHAFLVLLSLQDISLYKMLEEQLRQSQKMEAVGTLAGGVAHDFNNMLGVIKGHAELAMIKLDQAQPILSDLQAILQAANRSADLTRQLLAFARRQAIAPKVLDLNEVIERLLAMLSRLIGEQIELVWRPQTGLGAISMDPTQIDQILVNLCINARDAIAGVGKITMETHAVTLDADFCAEHPEFVPGAYTLLAVSDDGCGMDTEILDKLFEPFFTTKEIGKGTGLGLATVYGIVKQNNAFISVSSKPGQGTTFNIYLPCCLKENASAGEKRSEDQAAGGGETILLVEDEPAILEMTKLMLERFGYRVLAAAEASEAIDLARLHAADIDLLFSDVILPEMNGRELEEKIISFCPGLKTIFMSGYTGDIITRRGVLTEGTHFIQKPFSLNALADRVRYVLDGKAG
ncbi:MAG: response regulator [Deltaproteobacteria bacterium]|nr:response regulator [Deltaproteobacteria bacterium]